MAGFNPQPDEGYSEDPLTAQSTAPSTLPLKSPREDAVTTLGTLSSARSGDEFPPWLVQHISSLPLTRKTGKFHGSIFVSSSPPQPSLGIYDFCLARGCGRSLT